MEEGEVLEGNPEAMQEESEEKSNVTSYADTAAKLPTQSGSSKRTGFTMRFELTEDDWTKIWAMIHKTWMVKLLDNDWDPSIKVIWSVWLKGLGLIACENEFGFLRLITLFLPPSTNIVPEDKTIQFLENKMVHKCYKRRDDQIFDDEKVP